MDIASWSSNTFKNGLPYYGKMKVTKSDGQPAEGTEVEICAQPNYDSRPSSPKRRSIAVPKERPTPRKRPSTSNAPKYCAVRRADVNGIVSFELLPNEHKLIGYEIKVFIYAISCFTKK